DPDGDGRIDQAGSRDQDEHDTAGGDQCPHPQQFGAQHFARQLALELLRQDSALPGFQKADHSIPQFRGSLPQSSVRRKRVTAMVMATSIKAASASVSNRRFGMAAPFSMMAR